MKKIPPSDKGSAQEKNQDELSPNAIINDDASTPGSLEQPAPDLPDDSIPNRNIGKREWDEESEEGLRDGEVGY